MLQKALFAAAQFVALPVWNRQLSVLLCDTVPKILDKLKALRPAEFEKRREFLVHGQGRIVAAVIVQERRGLQFVYRACRAS
jgi:hypothetical protein